MSAAAVDRALYALAPPGGGAVLPPAVSAALPRALLAVALVLVSAWVLGPLGGLGSQPRVVSEDENEEGEEEKRGKREEKRRGDRIDRRQRSKKPRPSLSFLSFFLSFFPPRLRPHPQHNITDRARGLQRHLPDLQLAPAADGDGPRRMGRGGPPVPLAAGHVARDLAAPPFEARAQGRARTLALSCDGRRRWGALCRLVVPF